MSPARHHNALADGYQLHWYEIDSILGQGGFGITYLARDTNLDQLVAIKEFLPSDLAVRTQDSAVHPLSGGHTDTYGWGLNRFLTEARTLAKFRHPNIVRVTSVFEANNTAYMVMEYERGESFENLLKFKQISGEAALKKILLELLEGLELVHDAGFIHRDIKPSNVYLREDGVPVLLDFGSARLALGVETRTLTSLVSPGYAPFEQYNATRESDKQGPWTDIYALGATMYRAVTGHGPTEAAARANMLLDEQRDPFEPCSQMELAGYSREFLHAIDRALAFSPGERPQSVASWRQLVMAGAVDSEAATVAVDTQGLTAEGVDFVLDGDPDAGTGTVTRTVPMAAHGAATAAPPPSPAPATASARRWFMATSLVVVAGIAVAAWLSLHPRTVEEASPTELAGAAPPPLASPGDPPNDAAPAVPAAQPGPSSVMASNATAEKAETPVTDSDSEAAALALTTITEAAPPPQPAASVAPTPAAMAPPPPAPAPAAKTPPTPTPTKKTPEKVAKAAPAPVPASKPANSAPAPKKKPPGRASKPRTRAEKVAALLVSAEENLRADRLTTPKKRNALRDYLTALAIDKDSGAAHQGVENIVRQYVTRARTAIEARRFETANDNLHQARFVLDAMKLRKWPQATYDALFSEYRDTNQLLAASR